MTANNDKDYRIIVTSDVSSSELDDFLQKFPETRFMDVFVPDHNGILRGKRSQADEFSKVFGNGSNYVASTPLMNALGDITSDIIYGNDDGDPDLKSIAVPGSLAPVPWASHKKPHNKKPHKKPRHPHLIEYPTKPSAVLPY
jgi:glutamine synthetase